MLAKQFMNLMMNENLLIVQCLLFLILNILDGHSTWLVVKPDFYHRERNPIARWVFKKLRLPRAIPIFKAVIMSLLGVVIAMWWQEALTLNIGLGFGNVLFAFVVWHNYRVHRLFQRYSQPPKTIVWQVTNDDET